MKTKRLLSSILFSIASLLCFAQHLESLPLFEMQDLQYKGAFRISSDVFGVSSMNYAQGPIAYNKLNNSIFIVSHSHEQAIAEFAIPPLVISDELSDLNMATDPIQEFAQVLNRTSDGNPQNLNRIGGLYHYVDQAGEKLIVNAYEYYDAPGDNTLTTLVLDNAIDIANSSVRGYYQFNGGAGHTSGWISSIPLEWQEAIGSEFITGQSSGIPIISRTSVGPSAFAFSMDDLLTTTNEIATETLLDFSLSNALNTDLSNESGTNDIWTHLSRAAFGFIVPGTRTYATFGYSGGHVSGVCYKCTQNDGNLCGGYCAPDASDVYQYYWLWDINDLMKVKSGEINAYDVLPYDYGEFSTPFENALHEIGGGSFDADTGNLYLTVQRADNEQGQYRNPPVVLVYSTNLISSVDAYLTDTDITILPNPTSDVFEIRGLLGDYIIEVLDSAGSRHALYATAATKLDINLADLPVGMYFISIRNSSNANLEVRKIIKQ